jgi:hypothetical protein
VIRSFPFQRLLSAPQQAAAGAARPAALYNYNMFSYLDAKWFAPLIKVVVSDEPMVPTRVPFWV